MNIETDGELTLEELELLYDLTNHPGWEVLMKRHRFILSCLDEAVWTHLAIEDLQFAKGQRETTLQLLDIREATNAAIDDMKAEDAEDF